MVNRVTDRLLHIVVSNTIAIIIAVIVAGPPEASRNRGSEAIGGRITRPVAFLIFGAGFISGQFMRGNGRICRT